MQSGHSSTLASIVTSIDPANAGQRLDRALASLIPQVSRERVKALILESRVTTKGRAITDPSRKVAEGETFAIAVPEPVAAEALAQDIPLTIAYEDDHLIVIDKPAGLVVHPAAGNLDGTLVNALLHHCAGQLSGIGGVARPGIVHRIDKDTSGLMVAAKTDIAHEGLAAQFKAHSIERLYNAIVSERPIPGSGTVRTQIGRSSSDRKKMAVLGEGQGKHAVTHYRTLETLGAGGVGGAALIECKLETGRTHQVRVHMAHIGHALLGDPLYARPRKPLRVMLETLGFARQALHAAHLGFIHPVSSRALSFDSRMPADMQELLVQLRG